MNFLVFCIAVSRRRMWGFLFQAEAPLTPKSYWTVYSVNGINSGHTDTQRECRSSQKALRFTRWTNRSTVPFCHHFVILAPTDTLFVCVCVFVPTQRTDCKHSTEQKVPSCLNWTADKKTAKWSWLHLRRLCKNATRNKKSIFFWVFAISKAQAVTSKYNDQEWVGRRYWGLDNSCQD